VKAAPRAVLVKTHDHELAFDAVFDLYFTPQPGQAAPGADNSKAAEPGQPGQDGQGGLRGHNGRGSGGGPGGLDDAARAELRLTRGRGGGSPRATRPAWPGSARWSRRRSGGIWWTTAAPRPWPAPCAGRCRRTWTS